MSIQIVNGKQVQVKEAIGDYLIKQKLSSNVEYFGLGPAGEIFVQFKSGKSYLYKDVDPSIWPEMIEAESVGKVINARIVKAYKGIQHDRLVEPLKEEAGEQD
jgi:hypothetical protein